MHLIYPHASWHLTVSISYSELLSFCKRSAQQLVFGCPRSSKHGSELSGSTAALWGAEWWASCCLLQSCGPRISPKPRQISSVTDDKLQEAAPRWHSLCQQPAHLQWSHWHLLQNKYCLGFSIIYPPWPAMTQQQCNFELCISNFPQPHRTSKRADIHWYFRKPGLPIQGICMGIAGMTKDLWKTSVFQSDRWETGRVHQPASYRTGCLFLGHWTSWEPAHSWSHLNTGA